MKTNKDEIVLIAPPFSTSTSPYISLPTLMGWLKNEGITSHFVDLGRDLEDALICPEKISQAYDTLSEIFLTLNEKEALLPSEAIHLAELQILLRKVAPVFQGWEKDGFHNAERNLLIELVSSVHWPQYLTTINGSQFRTQYDIYSSNDLMASGKADFFFTAFLKDLIHRQIDGGTTLIAGISIVFEQQVIPAMQCARIIKELFPQIHITLGGPFVTIHLRQLQNSVFFQYVDSLILDEGENPLLVLYKTLLQEKTELHSVPNLVWCTAAGEVTRNVSEPFVDLGKIPAPDYCACRLDRYPDAKNMQLTVRLSKGCYWKRCAFCRVTLSLCRNYSQPDADTVYRSLCAIIDSTGVTNFLFSDESCAPEILEEISEKLCADKRKISWSFHTRIDQKRLTRSRVEKFKAAGCTEFAVGIETFNNRLLQLLNKGISEKEIEIVLHDLKGILPIKAYMMLGLPTETEEEFNRSFQKIQQFRRNGLLAGVQYSLFSLAPGSLMWKRPDLYGISLDDSQEGADLMPNNSTRFESGGMSRFQAFRYYIAWMRRNIPPNISDMPVIIRGRKVFLRYNSQDLFDELGERFIKQLDTPYVLWLARLDKECGTFRGRDPWWMIGD